MAVHRLLRVIRHKFIQLASGVARLIIKPSSKPICAQPATTKAVHHNYAPPPPPPHHDSNTSATTVDPAAASSSNHVHENTITKVSSADIKKTNNIVTGNSTSSTSERSGWETASYNRNWKAVEDKILQDIEPVARLAKSIIHPRRYRDGSRLTKKDEKDVIEKLLKYHYGFANKIGSGFKYIMVDRHVEFEDTRCMYVVRTDGSRIDFSYKKCLRGYVEHKYPSHAEKFVQRNPRLVK